MRISVFCLFLAAAAAARAADPTYAELDPARIARIAAMLPEVPGGFGLPAAKRDAWTDPDRVKALGGAVREAEKLLKQEFPPWDEEAYLTYSKTGSRSEGEAMQGRRGGWLYPLVMAECVEAKGRFLAKLNAALGEYAKEKTWTYAAHDHGLKNFNGTEYDVDLRSSAFAAELAQALYLLGDRIDPAVRAKVLAAVEQKVFAPMRASFKNGKGNHWLHVDNNWNAVCLDGVTCAALAAIPDKRERAVFVAAAEHYSGWFMRGFTDDGYCTEGAGYWNYGFGNFVNLRERILQATGAKIDLFRDAKIRNVALFGLRIQMADRIAPPYADCHTGSRPDDWIVRYCNLTLGLGVRGYDPPLGVRSHSLDTACMDAFPNSAQRPAAATGAQTLEPRSFFEKAGVLVCRPGADPSCRLYASIKAGGNGNHSHNDVGSFVVQLGEEFMLGDPGGPRRYTSKTFSAQRYEIPVIGSFGHPVPVVAGKYQVTATKVHPRVLSTKFTDTQDEIVIDLACAYDAPELKKLVRTFRYRREGPGSVTVEDRVEFSSPQNFEISIPTHVTWKQTGDRTFEFSSGQDKLRADVETPDGFDVASAAIDESAPPATRIALKLKKSILAGTVRLTLAPAK